MSKELILERFNIDNIRSASNVLISGEDVAGFILQLVAKDNQLLIFGDNRNEYEIHRNSKFHADQLYTVIHELLQRHRGDRVKPGYTIILHNTTNWLNNELLLHTLTVSRHHNLQFIINPSQDKNTYLNILRPYITSFETCFFKKTDNTAHISRMLRDSMNNVNSIMYQLPESSYLVWCETKYYWL